MTRIVTVIQARAGSTRLPGKVLMPIVGQPLLLRMIERVQAAQMAGTIVVATTTDPTDDTIETLCATHHLPCYRGSRDDLLDRHYQAGLLHGAEAVIKIPSDCPLIDPAIIDRVIQYYLDHSYDYVSNLHPATYPDGNDVEIMSMDTLHRAWTVTSLTMEREHCTPYIWEHPELFSIGNVAWERGLDYSMSHRWTIDYQQDYDFIRAVYEELYPSNPKFRLGDILELLERKPAIFAINAQYAGVNWYRNHLGELKTISKENTRQI